MERFQIGNRAYLIYFSDLEEGVTSKVLTHVDDAKHFRKTKACGYKKQNLQDEFDKLIGGMKNTNVIQFWDT